MATKTLAALLVGSIIGLAGPALAQGVPPGGVGGAIGGRSIIGTTPADNAPTTPRPAYIEEDTVVAAPAPPMIVAKDKDVTIHREGVPLYSVRPAQSSPWSAGMAAGLGGAIGGRAVLGVSPADNKPLPPHLVR